MQQPSLPFEERAALTLTLSLATSRPPTSRELLLLSCRRSPEDANLSLTTTRPTTTRAVSPFFGSSASCRKPDLSLNNSRERDEKRFHQSSVRVAHRRRCDWSRLAGVLIAVESVRSSSSRSVFGRIFSTFVARERFCRRSRSHTRRRRRRRGRGRRRESCSAPRRRLFRDGRCNCALLFGARANSFCGEFLSIFSFTKNKIQSGGFLLKTREFSRSH